MLTLPNRYLVTASGAHVGSRVFATIVILGGLLGSIVFGIAGATIGGLLDLPAVVALSIGLASIVFLASVVSQWVFLLTSSGNLTRAAQMYATGDPRGAVPLCHRPLRFVFRADIRTRALYILGLCAEVNGDFAEAADLFDRAQQMVPSMAAGKWQRHGRVLMFSHRAIALVATGQLDEADRLVRVASALFPPRPPGALDVLSDDAAFGAMGVSAALRDLEPGRDPRALLTLASITVLAARGMPREAVDLVERERYFLNAGLLPRGRAPGAHVEARVRGQLGGGPLRAAGMALPQGADPASEAWAQRILPSG